MTAPALSTDQRDRLAHAIDDHLYGLIGDCLPDSKKLSPIWSIDELRRRKVCLGWARELVEGAMALGLTHSFMGIEYTVHLKLAEQFLQAAVEANRTTEGFAAEGMP